MLKIIMGSEQVHKYTDKRLIDIPSKTFDTLKKQEWFSDKFVQEIIRTIDKAIVELGYSVRSINYDKGYSVDDLSGGTKTLILVYKIKDKIILTKMGDNCTDFIERIALEHEQRGEDLLIASDYLHLYNFKYIKAIEYLNWGIVCHSRNDIDNKIKNLWYEQEGVFERERRYKLEDCEPTEDEIAMTESLLRKSKEKEANN